MPNQKTTDLIRVSQLQEFQEINVHPSFQRDRVYDDVSVLCTWTISLKTGNTETENLEHNGH